MSDYTRNYVNSKPRYCSGRALFSNGVAPIDYPERGPSAWNTIILILGAVLAVALVAGATLILAYALM